MLGCIETERASLLGADIDGDGRSAAIGNRIEPTISAFPIDAQHIGPEIRQQHGAMRSGADAHELDHAKTGERGLCCHVSVRGAKGHLGAIRMAPSRRMTSPFSMGFAMMHSTSRANSSGFPSRLGKGT